MIVEAYGNDTFELYVLNKQYDREPNTVDIKDDQFVKFAAYLGYGNASGCTTEFPQNIVTVEHLLVYTYTDAFRRCNMAEFGDDFLLDELTSTEQWTFPYGQASETYAKFCAFINRRITKEDGDNDV
jgi:hypothetical protein